MLDVRFSDYPCLIYCVGFPHFVKAREIYLLLIYLFVYEREVLVTWFLFGVQ